MPWRKPCVVERLLVWKLLLNKEMLCSWMSWILKVVKWKQIGVCGMQDVVPWNRISDLRLKSSLNDPTQRIYRKHVIARTPMEFVQLKVVALGFAAERCEVAWGLASQQKPGWPADMLEASEKGGELVCVGALIATGCCSFCWTFHHLTARLCSNHLSVMTSEPKFT